MKQSLCCRAGLVGLLALGGCHGEGLKRPLVDTGPSDTASLTIVPPVLTVLATRQRQPAALAVNGPNVSWFNLGKNMNEGKVYRGWVEGQVMKCAVQGCDDSPTVLVSGRSQGEDLAFAADDSHVYWGDTGATGDTVPAGGLWRCATAGCDNTPTLVTDSLPRTLALGPDRITWTAHGAQVLTCPKSDCRANTQALWSAGKRRVHSSSRWTKPMPTGRPSCRDRSESAPLPGATARPH